MFFAGERNPTEAVGRGQSGSPEVSTAAAEKGTGG